MGRQFWLLMAGGILMLATGCASESGPAPVATGLRCENRVSPLGIDAARPRLSWQIQSARRGTMQSAYRVIVAGNPQALAENRGDVWDSGKVNSDQSVDVEYGGPALATGQTCYWKVFVWDRRGSEAVSEPSSFEMGCLSATDWQAKWIDFPQSSQEQATPTTQLTEKRIVNPHRRIFPPNRPPYVRKAFSVEKSIARARLYITALGLYRVWMNGREVSDAVLAPDWTNYHHRVRYQTFDITGDFHFGKNAISAILGDGWYSGNVGWDGAHTYGPRPALLAQIVIDYVDGSRDVIATDDTWKGALGPFGQSDFQDGEDYDARKEITDWNQASFDDSDWSAVSVRDVNVALEAQIGPPVRRTHEVPAVKITQPVKGKYVFDFGQNLVGFARLKASEPRGSQIFIAFAEMLKPDGTIYTENLRAARAIDSYVFKGDEQETWEPSFTFHGFRYAEVSGLSQKPDLSMLTGIAIGSDCEPAGTWQCDDKLIDQLYSNIIWGQRGNFISVPTDCPQRDERLGWMGDAQVFIPTATYNYDVRNFFANWLVEVADAQTDEGAFTDVSPHVGAGAGTAAWADAGVICPWTIYLMYGDKQIIEQQYPSMVKYIDYLVKHSDHLIRPAEGYGDWLNIDAETPKDVIATAYFAHSADLLSKMAAAIGKKDDAAKYHSLFEEIRKAFNEKFVKPDGRIEGDTQTAYLLALNFGLLDESKRPAAVKYLVEDIAAKHDHLSTGFVGVGLLLPTLTQFGATDVGYRLLEQQTFPSWLFPVLNGATTIWERWDGWTPDKGFQTPTMNSFNHYSLGSCGQWMYDTVAGIGVDERAPGFKHIVIRPIPGGNLKSASGSHESPYGTIKTRWEVSGKQFKLWVTIPANTSATVIVPGKESQVIEGAEAARRKNEAGDSTEFSVGSGDYVFTSTL